MSRVLRNLAHAEEAQRLCQHLERICWHVKKNDKQHSILPCLHPTTELGLSAQAFNRSSREKVTFTCDLVQLSFPPRSGKIYWSPKCPIWQTNLLNHPYLLKCTPNSRKWIGVNGPPSSELNNLKQNSCCVLWAYVKKDEDSLSLKKKQKKNYVVILCYC